MLMLLILSTQHVCTIHADNDGGNTNDDISTPTAEKVVELPNFYDFLNVSRDATETVIKRAYRKLAIDLHPDKLPPNLTEEDKARHKLEFFHLQTAYETLLDRNKRYIYDAKLSGSDIDPASIPTQDTDPLAGSTYSMLVKKKGFKMKLRVQFPRSPIPDISMVANVTLKEVLEGSQQNMTYHRRRLCALCHGSGRIQSEIISCDYCEGKGYSFRKLQVGESFEQVTHSRCEFCLGKGHRTSPQRCPQCYGIGTHYVHDWMMIVVPKAVADGHIFIYEEKGHEVEDGRVGNVHVKLQYDLLPGFSIHPNTSDLIYTYNTTIDALGKGLDFGFYYPTGEFLEVSIPSEVNAEDVLVGYELREEGMGMYKVRDERKEQQEREERKRKRKEEKRQALLKQQEEKNYAIDLEGFLGSEASDDEDLLDEEIPQPIRGDLVVRLGLNWTEISADKMFSTLLVSTVPSSLVTYS